MTSRLKRKLENQQDGNNSNLTESFVTYGTALPSLADKKDANEYVPVWEQTVTDEKGRRRFHGAFTGGFSAGYFNTVGTKEGWAPSQFTSSRSNRASTKQTANDFMDEEDLESMRSQQKVAVNQEFDILGGTQAEMQAKAGPSSEAFLLNMVQPGASKIGEKLLRKMGWREGQGIGPRISAKARRRQAKELGIRLDLEEEDDAMVDKHLFAPLDRPLVLYPEKTNAWGLGYKAGATLVDSIGSTSDVKGKSRMKAGHVPEGTSSTPLGGAFGIGALEDADEDDYSVYDTSAKGNGQRIMDLDDDDNGPSSYEISRKGKSSRLEAVQKPSRPSTSTETYHDGTPALPGFSISSLSIQPDMWFEPPEIPRNWEPQPKRVFDLANKPTAENGAAPVTQGPSGRPPPPTDARGRPVLNADDRGSMLGEDQIKAPPRSVFDFISAKNKERISQLTSKATSTSSLPSAPATQESVVLTVPTLDKPTAVAALKGFMPFGDDHAKQDRYRFYLRSQAGELEGTFNPKCEPGRMSELNRELEDFAKSAKVFKPMSSAMAGRFVSSSSENTAADMKTPQPGLRQVEMEEPKEEAAEEKQAENLTPAAIAVRTGQFGILTRSTDNFYPVRLLCKRFNVPDPHPDGPAEGEEDKEEKELLNKQKMDDLRQEGGFTAPQPYDLSTTTGTPAPATGAKPSGTVGLGEDDTQGKETLTYERPPMDLFKAIFAESESESEDEENKPVRQPAPAPIKEEPIKPTAPVSAPPSNPLEPISFTDFKPTFVPKSDRTTSTALPEKKKKDKKKKKAALSFAVEDDEDTPAPKEKRKKSKDSSERDKKRRKEEPVEDEWVEKEVVAPPVVTRVGRAKASDFL